MYLDDSDITQQFEILREGILRDVFSQRASSAWQGMQPQRLTVSLLLPCMNSEADEWLDFMQCQRQFWPTMTTRHASLAPIELGTFRRERRLMQSKHLWDTLSIDWHKLDSKLYNAKPTEGGRGKKERRKREESSTRSLSFDARNLLLPPICFDVSCIFARYSLPLCTIGGQNGDRKTAL